MRTPGKASFCSSSSTPKCSVRTDGCPHVRGGDSREASGTFLLAGIKEVGVLQVPVAHLRPPCRGQAEIGEPERLGLPRLGQ